MVPKNIAQEAEDLAKVWVVLLFSFEIKFIVKLIKNHLDYLKGTILYNHIIFEFPNFVHLNQKIVFEKRLGN